MDANIPFILVDGNNLLYRAAYGFPTKIYNRNKEDITTIFAFFALLRIAFKEIGYPISPVVCFDGEHCLEERRLQISSYKENRINNRLNPYGALPLILDSLKTLHIPVVIEDTLEADDLIAHFVVNQNHSSFIMSSDKDFYQLLNDKVFVLNTMRKSNERIITREHIIEKFGVTPEQWVYYRALMGDASDFIKGIEGVGPKTAWRLLQLTEKELRLILVSKYQTSWEDFQKIVQIIRLDKLNSKKKLIIKDKVIEDFVPPAKVIEKLGLWG
jgi:DNA polymerase I